MLASAHSTTSTVSVMSRGTTDSSHQLWCVLNILGLILVLGYGGLFTLFVVVVGTDHGEAYADEWAPRWAIGAVAGLLTGLLAGRYDRRYLPWTAALMLAGVMAASLAGGSYRGVPLVPAAPLLAASVVLHARTRRDSSPVPAVRRQMWTGLLVTVTTLIIVGAATVHVALASRSTPLYDAMRADPMATDELPGMVVRFDFSKDQTTPFGIPSAAGVSRLWTITDGSTQTDKLDEVEDLAVQFGWTEGPDPMFCGWQKVVDGYSLCLVIRPGVETGEVIVDLRRVEG